MILIMSIEQTIRVQMNVNETATFLKSCPETVRRWARQGKLPAHRVGKRGYYFFYQDEVARELGIEPLSSRN